MNRPSGYDPAYFEAIAAVERRHFWFRARGRVLRTVLAPLAARLPAAARVLEVGCGTGNTLRVLEESYPAATIVGMDLFADGLRYARTATRAHLLQGRIEAAPFRTRFDVIGLFDVLEHIEHDEEALRAIHGLLEPGGHLAITVPADPHLWSDVDVVAHHWRRYARAELIDRIERAGFAVSYVTPFMTVTYPLLWLSRRLERGPELDVPAWLNAVLDTSLRPERWLLRARLPLPFGTSLLALATRR